MSRVGQNVIVSVVGNIYFGTITFATDRYINIEAIELKTSTPIATKFYKNEIRSIRQLKKGQHSAAEDECEFTLAELVRVSNMLHIYSFVEQFDVKYHSAIADIASESCIGFHMPGIDNGRFSEASIIAISTSKMIYLFDIRVMGRIEKGIKNILEANAPKKIIHDASRCADHLKHKHNIHLAGVFDTMIAHYYFGYGKERRCLDECLCDHLKLPENCLDEDRDQWHRRPLPSSERQCAVQSVAFLKKLYNKLTGSVINPVE